MKTCFGVLSPSRSDLVLQSSRLDVLGGNRDMQIEHGFRAWYQTERKGWIFILSVMETCFVAKSVRFGRTELSICHTGGESRDLEFEHGFRAYCLRSKRGKSDFHTCGDEKAKQKLNSLTKSVECWSLEL